MTSRFTSLTGATNGDSGENAKKESSPDSNSVSTLVLKYVHHIPTFLIQRRQLCDHTDTVQVDTLQSLRPPFQLLSQCTETAVWLNSLLHSFWPIVNPALFTSISDMLEGALQASLPSFVHGVYVADISQGSEPMCVLGIRWLDSGNLRGDIFDLEVAVAYRARTVKRQKGKGLRDLADNAH
ncbi:hypothetical protein H2248_002279 [Termitomyces sp. 'cryptogamus']|nr:hypothetical protein H2248_002279 [Termitomyces sp. 'cryptogamus']